jgi:hypothetical protein
VELHLHLPKPGRLSTIIAGILICYAFLPFMQVPARLISFPLFGIAVSLQLNFYNLISLITGVMAAAGMDWILFDHPHRKDENHFTHLILPALTAGAIGFPLGLLKPGAEWWIILGLGSLLVVLVMLSEYISIEPNDIRYPLALMVLSGTSYSILLILSIALRSAGIRLFLLLLLLPPVYAFFSLRILKFRLGGPWRFQWSAVITLIVTQILIALFYWPLSPVRFGLFLLGPTYAMIGIAASLEENPDPRNVYLEPLMVMAILWIMAIFIG